MQAPPTLPFDYSCDYVSLLESLYLSIPESLSPSYSLFMLYNQLHDQLAYSQEVMEVQVHRSTILSLPVATDPTEIPLNVFDLFASDINIAVLFAFTAPAPSNADLILALSNTLPLFPLLTARLGHTRRLRRPCLVLSDGGGGALVLEATVDVALSDLLPLEPSPDLALLHPPIEGAGAARHLLQVQLNRFRCGGLVAAAVAHHRVADGQSMSAFFVAWGRVARGEPVGPLPLHDRSWLRPRCPPRCEFRHWDVEFAREAFASYKKDVDPCRIRNILLRYSAEFIDGKLKSRMQGKKYTTFETLVAHLWRKITVARGLDDRDHTMIRVTVNGRPRMRPPVPNEYFGNLVLNAYPESGVKQLLEAGMEAAAEIIHAAIWRIDESYFQSVVDFGALHEDDAGELVPVYDTEGNVLSPALEVDSWLRFGFQEVDFGGGGKLCAFLPTWVPYEGLLIFVPALEEGGGIDVVATLLEEHVAQLKLISHDVD